MSKKEKEFFNNLTYKQLEGIVQQYNTQFHEDYEFYKQQLEQDFENPNYMTQELYQKCLFIDVQYNEDYLEKIFVIFMNYDWQPENKINIEVFNNIFPKKNILLKCIFAAEKEKLLERIYIKENSKNITYIKLGSKALELLITKQFS